MSKLLFRKEKNRIIAELDGVKIPLVSKIEMISLPNELPKMIIEVVVAKTMTHEVVIDINNEHVSSN
jgi:hypothetical protein